MHSPQEAEQSMEQRVSKSDAFQGLLANRRLRWRDGAADRKPEGRRGLGGGEEVA